MIIPSRVNGGLSLKSGISRAANLSLFLFIIYLQPENIPAIIHRITQSPIITETKIKVNNELSVVSTHILSQVPQVPQLSDCFNSYPASQPKSEMEHCVFSIVYKLE